MDVVVSGQLLQVAHAAVRRVLGRVRVRGELAQSAEPSCVATLAGHEARVWCVTADESRIFSCGADRSITVWCAAAARSGRALQLAQLTGSKPPKVSHASPILSHGAQFPSMSKVSHRTPLHHVTGPYDIHMPHSRISRVSSSLVVFTRHLWLSSQATTTWYTA